MRLITEDNRDYSLTEMKCTDEDKCNLSILSSKCVAELCQENNNLLIFPYNLNQYGDNIDLDYICKLSDEQLSTGNIMGFVGFNNTQLTIRSRFAKDREEDFFMHYMLQKVFSINIFNLQHSASDDSVFDFLLYLFPYHLKKALRQGIFKQYQSSKGNNANIRGTIDIKRHITQNIPFNGKVAYTTHEYCYDNPVTQLIRHTIEYINNHRFAGSILKVDRITESYVTQIYDATPTYSKNNRQNIINQNIRPLRHPYFSEYANLQKLCLQILCHKKIKYGTNNNQIYGLLFDGAWLWEEYLNTLLHKHGFIHPQNKLCKKAVYLFEDHPKYPRYPDFHKSGFILDAKYKAFKEKKIYRDDIHQLITYMYVEQASRGGFIYPQKNDESPIHNVGILRGYGGNINLFGVSIPQEVTNFKDFRTQIANNEAVFLKSVIKDDIKPT